MPEYYLRRTDRYAWLLLGLSALLVLLSLVPDVPGGFLQIVPLLLLRVLAMRPLCVHMGAGTRIFIVVLVLTLKVMIIGPLLILTLVLSWTPLWFLSPVVGLLILLPMAGRYFYARWRFKRMYVKKRKLPASC